MSAKDIKKKLADLAERIVLGTDDGQSGSDDLRKTQEEAQNQEGP